MYRLLDRIAPELSQVEWQRGCYEFAEQIRKRMVCYYYWLFLVCIEYLYQQHAYTTDMVYRHTGEYNEGGERMYSELYMADWWCGVLVTHYIPRSLELLDSPYR